MRLRRSKITVKIGNNATTLRAQVISKKWTLIMNFEILSKAAVSESEIELGYQSVLNWIGKTDTLKLIPLRLFQHIWPQLCK